MSPRLRIGLTGGIASGKSTVEQRFAELGVPVIDADDSARAVVARGQPGLAAVIERFGAGVLTANGELDRRALRDLIFRMPREAPRSRGHPASVDPRPHGATGARPPPALISSCRSLCWWKATHARPATRGVDRILVVDADESQQLQRLMSRDSVSEAQARAILGAQA